MPDQIKYFERCMLASLAIGLINSILFYSQPAEEVRGVGSVLVQLFTAATILLLVLLTSRKRSNVAKWIFLIMYALGLIMYAFIPQLTEHWTQGLRGVISIVQLLIQLAAIYFLFTPEGRAWFRKTVDSTVGD